MAYRIYPFPDGEPISDLYTVSVEGNEIPCYTARVSAIPFNRPWPGMERSLDQTEMAAFVTLQSDTAVALAIKPSHAFTQAIVRPQSANICPRISGDLIHLTVGPGQYSLELDGRHCNLQIFIDPPSPYIRNEDALYFGPGIHDIDHLMLHSGQTVYVDAGAVVYARTIRAYDAENIRIIGNGILDFSRYQRTVEDVFVEEDSGSVSFIRCKNIHVDGVILRDATWWTMTAINCTDICYNNVKVIGMWRYNADGLDFVNSEHVTVTNCFIRSFDDSIVLKGLNKRKNGECLAHYDYMNVCHYRIEHCVVWCDWGGALEIGAETVADEYTDIVFRDIDIIRNADGGMRIHCGDRAEIHDVLYEHIRVEYTAWDRDSVFQQSDDTVYTESSSPHTPPFIRNWMYWGPWTPGAPNPHSIHHITYRDIQIIADAGIPTPCALFHGTDADHGISEILMENITYNGIKLNADTLPINQNLFAENITVK